MLATTRTSRRNVLLVGAALFVLGVGLASFLSPGAGTPPSANVPPTPAVVVDGPPGTGQSSRVGIGPDGGLPPLPPRTDSELFARDVASALFDWDTTAGPSLSAHRGRLLAIADPAGVESPGLVSDLAMYLPTEEIWAALRPYSTRQWIEIESAVVPALWEQALAEADGGFAPGTTAYTITGVRHRTGVDDGEPIHVEFDVAFTVFAVCEPSYTRCYLLRLSQLDNPLK